MENEKRLIDANALRDRLKDEQNDGEPINDYGVGYWNGLTMAQSITMAFPTVDAVEVVRCKDCKHCKKHPTSDRVKMCTNEHQWVTECYPLVHDDDFCSYGERRNDV